MPSACRDSRAAFSMNTSHVKVSVICLEPFNKMAALHDKNTINKKTENKAVIPTRSKNVLQTIEQL